MRMPSPTPFVTGVHVPVPVARQGWELINRVAVISQRARLEIMYSEPGLPRYVSEQRVKAG